MFLPTVGLRRLLQTEDQGGPQQDLGRGGVQLARGERDGVQQAQRGRVPVRGHGPLQGKKTLAGVHGDRVREERVGEAALTRQQVGGTYSFYLTVHVMYLSISVSEWWVLNIGCGRNDEDRVSVVGRAEEDEEGSASEDRETREAEAARVKTLMSETSASAETLSSNVTPTRESSISRKLMEDRRATSCTARAPPGAELTSTVNVSKNASFSTLNPSLSTCSANTRVNP